MHRARNVLLVTLAALAIGAMGASAATTDGFDVIMQVDATCSILAVDHDFGVYDRAVGNTGASTLTVNCTLLTPYSVGIDSCTHGSAVDNRMMKLTTGAALASYTLTCADATSGCFANWGVTAGVDTFDGIGIGLDVPVPVVGLADAGQNLPAGDYRDTCLATVSF
jgi:spore coat protein U domain-containing protein, fimbrial subunit CupE1/2/3/6